MGLVEDYQKIEQGRLLSNYIGAVTSFIQQIDSRLGHMVSAKATYPEAATEIDGYIAQAKNALQNIVNKY